MVRTRLIKAALTAGLAAFAFSGPSQAATWTSFSATYGISLGALPIGKLSLDATVNDSAYRMSGNGRVSGIARLVSNGQGQGSATGSFGGSAARPTSFDYSEVSGGESLALMIRLASGNVKSAKVTPPQDRMDERVPVKASHKRGVVDPFSMLLMPSRSADRGVKGSVCQRTLKVYDGRTRFDLILKSAGTETVRTDGYDGPAAVCTIAFKPVSGHRDRKTVREAAQTAIRIWMAPIGETRVFAPIKLSAKTKFGVATIAANRFLAGDYGQAGTQ